MNFAIFENMFYRIISYTFIFSILVSCRSDKSIYKPKKRRKGKCDCPHLSINNLQFKLNSNKVYIL